jgi:hypothetical protein
MKSISNEEALSMSDLNLGAYVRHVSRYSDGDFEERDGVVLFAGVHPNPQPYTNGLMRIENTLSAEETLERGRAFFRDKRRSYAVWIRDHADRDLEEAARTAGYWQRPPVEGQPAVFIEDIPPAPGAENLDIRRVETEDHARAYLQLVGDVYDMGDSPQELVWAMFLPPQAVLAPEVAAYTAHVDGDLVAGCMAFVAHELGGMFWAVRKRAAEGHGLGAACAAACVEAAFEMGARVASGQGSARGTPLWVSLGWEVLTHYRRYLAPPPGLATSERAA